MLCPSVPVTGFLSSISVFKQDKESVYITDLSSPDFLACHSPRNMKASSFCLKKEDERRTAARDVVDLTDSIRVADLREGGMMKGMEW